MPELPEIETIRTGLLEKVLGKPVLKVDINNVSVIRNEKKYFIKSLMGEVFGNIERRGKMLIFTVEDQSGERSGKFLLVRLGMTGRLVYFDQDDALWGGYSFEKKNTFSYKHCHAVFRFEGGGALLYCDSRKFGYLEIVDEKGLEGKLKSFGPEPLEKDFTLAIFRKIMNGKKTNIKAFLLNQKYIAGIGNIYADEILFDARILPTRSADNLSPKEIEAVYKSIKKILKKAVANRGTTFSDYVDSGGEKGNFQKHLKVYGRSGMSCYDCDEKINKIVVAGRGTHFCPNCQK